MTGALPSRSVVLAGAAAGLLLPVAGVTAYLTSADHAQHDPVASLQQLDLLYLDQPAPGLAAAGAPAGRTTLLLFCRTCPAPRLQRAAVVRVTDPGLAAAYGLGAPGRPGYALVDARGHVRYRSYDPHVGDHATELQILVDGVAP